MWIASLDGDMDLDDARSTRALAEADATWLRNHPARRDRVRGGGGAVRVLRVAVDEWTGELVEVGQ